MSARGRLSAKASRSSKPICSTSPAIFTARKSRPNSSPSCVPTRHSPAPAISPARCAKTAIARARSWLGSKPTIRCAATGSAAPWPSGALFVLEWQIRARRLAAIGIVNGDAENVGAFRRAGDVKFDVAHIVERQLARLELELAETALPGEHLSVRRADFEIDHELGGKEVSLLFPGDADRLGIDDDRLLRAEGVTVAGLIGGEAVGDVLDEQNAAETQRRLV